MKKRDLKYLALMGLLSAGTIINPLTLNAKDIDPDNEGNRGYHLFTEEELLLEVNEKYGKIYKNLTPEGKALARKVASQRCNGTNDCKGLNACKTEKNDCAGQGQCRGTSKCGFSDKNLAVKVAAMKMAEKRKALTDNTSEKH